jgi:hypothetical protein
MRNRYWPTALVFLAVVVLGWYLVYTQLLMREMRRVAQIHSSINFQVLRAMNDPDEGAAVEALFALSEQVRSLGIPTVVVDPDGFPTAVRNLPFAADLDNPEDQRRIAEYVRGVRSGDRAGQPADDGATLRNRLRG